jgi:hypothetical protein
MDARLRCCTYNAWQRWESRPVRPLDGALAPDEPVQSDLESAATAAPVRLGRWLLTPRANYDITARILSREDYRFDRLADLVPELAPARATPDRPRGRDHPQCEHPRHPR